MEHVIKLYSYIDGINDKPFPSDEEQVVITSFKYEANRMGGAPVITATVMHGLCLDNMWNDNVYAEFNGERYYVKSTPTSSKSNDDTRYKHELELVSERDKLSHVYFIDAVQSDSSVDKYKSNSTKVQFSGDLKQFVDRLNDSLSYSGLDYTAVIDEGISTEDKYVTFENLYVTGALQEAFNSYGIPYYFVGKTIHFGYTSNAITTELKYGSEDAFLSISKQNTNSGIINRITGTGSSDNIPFYYPNSSPKGELKVTVIKGEYMRDEDFEVVDQKKFSETVQLNQEIEFVRIGGYGSNDYYWKVDGRECKLEELGIQHNIAIGFHFPQPGDKIAQKQVEGSFITIAQNLMPSIYRETKGAERFYNAKNDTYPDGEGGNYVFGNEYVPSNPMEGIAEFSEIKPTIKGVTNDAGKRIDMFVEFAYDEDDNDEVDEEGNYLHPYFFAKLRKTDGKYGFNLFDESIEGQTMQVSFVNGICGACTFEIAVGEETQKNLVQVGEATGELLRDDGGYVLCGREDRQHPQTPQDRQNDTRNNEVWIALKKDDSTYPQLMPNKNYGYRPSTDDNFVILGINLPDAYVIKAEDELERELIKYMWENNMEKFTFSVKFSRIFFTEHPEILVQLNENARVLIEYNGIQHSLYISSYTYSMDDNSPLPEISVELVDTLSIGSDSLQSRLDDVKKDILSSIGGGDFLKSGLKYFIRKDTKDTARGRITFLNGIDIGTFTSGSSGATARLLEDLTSYIEVDKLRVRVKAYFETLEIINTNSVGGKQILTAGGGVYIRDVVDREEVIDPETGETTEDIWPYYRCYFLTEQDGRKIDNRFRVGDLAISQSFNIKAGASGEVTNHYYWREVVGIGEDYVDLSKSICDTGSDAPEAEDVICHLGNRSDKDRQGAIVFSAVDTFSPSITLYYGINDFSLVGKDYVSYGVDKSTGNAFYRVYGEMYAGDREQTSYVKYTPGEGVEMRGKFINQSGESYDSIIQAIQDAVNGNIETWWGEEEPTLSNEPAVSWTTDEEKNDHLGDLYYTDDGVAYRFQMKGGDYIWQMLKDSDITKALADAKDAKDAADAANTEAKAASDRLSKWAADNVISPAEKQSIKDEIARIDADKENITSQYTKYGIGTPKAFNDAYTVYREALVSLSADEPETISIPSDFPSKQINYYKQRTLALGAIADASIKSVSDVSQQVNSVKEQVNTVKQDVNALNSSVQGLREFTDEAFLDGIIDRNESAAISAQLDSIETFGKDVSNSYEKVYNNELLTGTPKTELENGYKAFVTAKEELVSTISAAISDGLVDTLEKASVKGKYDAFNTRYGDFVAFLNAANKAIQNAINSNALDALQKIGELDYLKAALKEFTTIEGGLIQSSTLALGYTSDSGYQVMAGTSGVYDDSKIGGGIASWWGGAMFDRFEYTEDDMPENVAKGVIRMDGTGYFANGNLWWEADGTLHADPLSFFVGPDSIGDLLSAFQIIYNQGGIEYINPLYPFQKIEVGDYIQVGNGMLYWDADKNAFYVRHSDGVTPVGFYTTGFLSAKGANDGEGEGGGGGGLAYSRLDTWEGYTEPDMAGWVLSAYLGYRLYKDVNDLKQGAAISYVTQGTGNAVTDVTKLNGQLVFTRGKTFSELGHTHPLSNIYDLHSSWDAVLKAQKPNWLTAVSLATISDLHANWDAILKVAPTDYVTRWPTAAEVGALTQATADGRYALKTVTITAGAGLSGGGNLSANRTLSLAAVGTAGTYTKVTTDAYGRVTAHASLSAADIPTLSISKISGLQAALDKKLEATAFNELFEKVTLADGTTAIRAKYGLYTDSFLSSKGANPEAGTLPVGATTLDELEDVTIDRPVSGQTLVYDGFTWRNQEAAGGLDEDELSAWLTNHQYALKGDITIALSGYATEDWVEGRGYLTSASLSGYATQTWVKQQGYITSAALSGYATQSWVNQKLASYYTSTRMDTLLSGKVDKVEGKGLSSNDFTDALLAKLNGIAAGANKYTLPTATDTTLGGVKVGATLAIASSVLNLKAVGTAGTYTKVTTDAYGRVTAGAKLAASDIPSLDWGKITSGKPTTLGGYGITDGVTTPAYTGSGNVLTAATISGHTITFTKGITAALASRKVTAGKGLTGGGALTADITLNVASANAGISVNADNIQLNTINALTSTDTVKPLSAAQGKKIWDFVTDLFEKVNIGTSSAPVYAIRAKYGLFSDEFLSAKGANDSEGEGGGVAYNRLDTWDGYSEALAGWVLSAGLGYSLYTDVNSLKQGAAVSLVTEGSGNAVTDIAKSGTKLTVTKGLAFLTAHQNIFPLTIQGNGTSLAKYTPNSAALTVNITPANIGAATSGHTHSQYLTAVSLATISDLHSSWDAVLKAQKPNWLTAHQAIYALTLQGNGSTIGTYNPKSAAATINLTAATLRLGMGNVPPQTGRTQNYGWLYSYNCTGSTTGDRPTTYMSVVGFGLGTGGTVEIAGGWTSGMGLWYRALRDYQDDWYEWRKLLDSTTYTEYTVTKTGGGASGTWGIGISGNAATASKWAAKRTITLTGAVTGSVSLDGSGNVSLATTYATGNISALDGRYLLKSAYTAADVLAKLKTVDGSGSGLDADTLDGLQLARLMRCDGANAISLTGGNGNTDGYRLVIQKTMTEWSINNIVFVVASRHNGQGIMSIAFHTHEKISSYTYQIRFFGATLNNNTQPWRAFYNASTGVFRLYWHYSDYTTTGINVLRREGFPAPSNGTWYETLPSDNGTELGISYNSADTLGGTAKGGLLTALSSSSGTNLSLTVGGTTKTVADLYATTAAKLGTATVGGTARPIYLNGGTATALTGTVGSGARPVYLNGGTITAGTYTFGNASGNAALNNGTLNTNLNADLLDGWHGVGTSGNALKKSGFVTSGTAGLSSYWGKLASFTWSRQYNDQDITLYMHSAYNGWYGIVALRGRWSSATDVIVSVKIIAGNIAADALRLYYDPSSAAGTLELWCNVVGQYNVFNAVVLSETNRTGVESGHVTLYSNIFSTAQTLSSRSYVSGQYVGIINNAASATKLQTARQINGTNFDGSANITTAKWGTARSIYIRDASQAHTGAAVSVDGSANEYLLLPATITATLSGNASSASKLQTARTLWGQSFNGTGNVSGNLSGVGSISASGNFSTSKATNTYLAGNQGQALVNSTAAAGAYVMLHRGCSTNGYFTLGTYKGNYLLQYTAKSTVTAGTNSVTKSLTLLNEAGNSSFPGTLYAKTGLYSDGYVSAKGQNQSSDERLKNIIRSIYLDVRTIAKAPSFRFSWKDGTGIDVGSSAQYWKNILPDAVKERNGFYEMAYGNIALICAISISKEVLRLSQKVERHDEYIDSLKRENDYLRRRVDKLESRLMTDR